MRAKPSSGVVTGTGKPKAKVGPRTRATLLIAVGVLILAGIAGGAWAVLQNLNEKPASKIPKTATATTINGKPLTDTQKAQQAVYYGDYNKGQSILEDQVNAAATPDAKVAIYLDLATNAFNEKKYDDAKSYCNKAIAIKKTAATYSLLAQTAAAQGNKQQAIDYANEQKKLLDSSSGAYGRQVKEIDTFIKGLQQ